MSAIAGIVQRHGGPMDLGSHLQLALEALAAYGPEGSRYWVGERVGLGHQQMVITPEDALEQLPAYDALSGLAITADVRLDNREELSAALGIPPPERTRIPDSGLILRAYQKWGHTCLAHLLGDFAFAIWDRAERLLYCARDYIGTKPFYYSLTPERCVFASDINGVLAVPGISHQLNDAFVAAYLQEWAFPHDELTFFQAICKLPPAHTLTVRGDACRLERYWYPDRLPDIRLPSDAAYVEAFLDRYTQAVETRLRSLHPVGTHVSGGLDSSSMAVLAAQALRRHGKPLRAFCWEPPPQQANGSVQDERGLIQAVCDQEDLPVHYLHLTEADCLALLQRDVTREPTLDTLMYEEQVQQQAAAHQIRVLLSGWGGDEFMTFNGRGYYAQLVLQGRWRTLYRELHAADASGRKLLVMYGLVPLVPLWCQNMVSRFRPNLVHQSVFQSYIHPAFAHRMRRHVKGVLHKPLRMIGVRHTQLWLLHLGHLTQRMEAWAANAARHRIVYRYPLLDRRVVEFALGVPPEFFLHNGRSRCFARQALETLLPTAVVWNEDKTDPARSQRMRDVIPKALITLGHQIAARATLSPRAAYLDTPRLLKRLTSGAPIDLAEAASLWHAVQFLGDRVVAR